MARTPSPSPEPRWFGLGAGLLLCGAAGILALWKRAFAASIVLGALGLVLLVVALIAPQMIRPIRAVWMRIAFILNWFNTRVLLLLVFYLVVTPTGVVLRLFGKDPMSRGWRDSQKASYWIKRSAKPFDREHMERQF